MCTAAVRPKRATRAAGSASWLVMVPVALDAFDSVSVNVSLPSLCSSSMTGTSTVPDELPVPIVSVPEVDV